MRVFCLPNADDVKALDKDFAGDVPAMLAETISDVESQIGHHLAKATITGEIQLGRGRYLTQHFPIRNLKVQGAEHGELDVDPEMGIIRANVQRGPYLFSYEVGYEDGTLPATLQKLIYAVMSRKMNVTDKSKEDVATLLLVWKTKRDELEKARNAPETY